MRDGSKPFINFTDSVYDIPNLHRRIKREQHYVEAKVETAQAKTLAAARAVELSQTGPLAGTYTKESI
ncbi:hypothetical protein D1871_07980 [Nakamurella silvestris]|nr:hypothetical protein D1871_07980 [Nakamurella silvestris]